MNDSITRCTGLVLQYNPLATAPGALIRADNCVINRENIVEDRRGYALYGALANAVTQLLIYSGRVIAHNGTKLSYDDGAGNFSDFNGSYTAPSGYKSRGVEAFGNLYFTTNLGVQVATGLATSAGTIRNAGSPRSLDGSYALNAAGSGFLATSFQCAYRFVIQRTDANSNVIYGYPSTRMWVPNTAGSSKNVDVTLYLPAEAATTDVIQVYRTAQVSGTSSDTSGDEDALVYQANPSSTDISNGYIAFTDSITDALRGASLYTSPSQETITQANDRPPLCKDVALYKSQYMMYANTSTKQRLFFTLVGTSGLTGKTITLGGVTYNFGNSEIISGAGSPKVLVGSSGVAAVDIESTARSLVKVINRYAGNTTVYAYYQSGPSDLPGQILIEERGVGAAAFTVQASDTTIQGMFFPPPPVGSTTSASTSSNQVQKNSVYYSKAQQPEAVPSLNYIVVGPSNKNILRIAALKTSLVIIKEEGVYLLTGDNPQSFVVSPLDLTVYCKSADSVAVLANQVFMLSNQGVVAISETGVTVVSREIEPALKPLLGFSGISTYATGCAYESERTYLLSLMTVSADTVQNQIYLYNFFTRTWAHWTFGFCAAIIEPTTDKLHLAKPSVVNVYKERKDFADTDYSDPETAITMTAVDTPNKKVTFTISGATPGIGWVISQGGTGLAVSAIDSSTGSYIATMEGPLPTGWTTGAATIYPSVGFEIIWDSWQGGQPGMLKQVSEFAVLTDNIPGNNTATVLIPTFKSNFDEEQETVTIIPPGGSWGGSWGAIPWGGSGDGYGYRTFVPRNKQFCVRLNPGVQHKRAQEKLAIAGCAFNFEMISERIGK